MFWKRKTVESTEPAPATPHCWIDSETADYVLYAFAPGERVYLSDIQAMRDTGHRPLFVDGPSGMPMVVCEKTAL